MKYATIAIAASSTDWQAFAGSRRGDQGATGLDFTGGSIDTCGGIGDRAASAALPTGRSGHRGDHRRQLNEALRIGGSF